jgi:hypothetical protein
MFKSFIEYANNLKGTNESIVTEGKGWAKLMKAVRAGSKSGPWTIVSFEGYPSKIVNQEHIQYMDLIPAHYEEVKKRFPRAKMSIEDNTGMSVYNESLEIIDEVFIGPFVFNDTMSDEELKAMYDGALDGYANWQKGFQHPKSDYKKAYQEIEKLLKKRGVEESTVTESALSSDELGAFYTKAINFVDTFKKGGNQKLRDAIGEDLFFQRGKEWFFNAWNVKKLTSSEADALLKKLETNESVVTEGVFFRLSKDVIGDELYAASKNLTTFYDRAAAGNDVDDGAIDAIIKELNTVKKAIKKFNNAEEVKGTAYESVVTEGKDDYMARYKDTNINLKKAYNHLNDEELNQLYLEIGELIADNKLKVKDATFTFESVITEARSINKIQKDWTNVTAMMKDAVADWKSAEGKDKEDLLDQLKVLTISKKKIEAELEDAVGLKDMDVELAEGVISILNEGVNELNERTITLKRRYTENHPALTAGKTARIRNKMLEAIADGKLTEEEFNTVLSEMSPDSSRWIRRNARFFNVSEDGITLSKYGMKAYRQTKVNEIEIAEAFVIENFEAFESTVVEIKTSMISGNSGRTVSSLEDRKYELTKEVKGARIGDFVNVILPKGTIIYNLPGGVFANHPSLKDTYTSKYGNGPKWVSQSWGEGVSVRQEPETLEAIEKNSKVL